MSGLDSSSAPVLVDEIEALGRWISRVREEHAERDREAPIKLRAYATESDAIDLMSELADRYHGAIPTLYDPIEGVPPVMAVIRRVIRHLEHRSEG